MTTGLFIIVLIAFLAGLVCGAWLVAEWERHDD